MIDPESLSPGEVLAHLKQLGYKNISSPQLSEFMHDLKKLIRYEQNCRHGFEGVFDDNDNKDNYSSTYSQLVGSECSSGEDSKRTDSSELCSNCNESKNEVACNIIIPMSSSTDIDSTKKRIQFCHQTKPQSSFIRPWKLQPSCKGTATGSLKCDPVRLYHKYRELWAQQKVPGEKSHSQLRWTIREKMLGRDPQPRPVSQTSNDCRRLTYLK